jgi:hypothetical protein
MWPIRGNLAPLWVSHSELRSNDIIKGRHSATGAISKLTRSAGTPMVNIVSRKMDAMPQTAQEQRWRPQDL